MKLKLSIGILISVGIFLFISNMGCACAGPRWDFAESLSIIGLFLATFIIYNLLEYIVAQALLYKHTNKFLPLLIRIHFINFITVPITLFIAGVIFHYTQEINKFPYAYYFYLAGLFPLIAEYYLLKYFLKKLFKNGSLKREITNKEILLISILMNSVTLMIWFTITSPY